MGSEQLQAERVKVWDPVVRIFHWSTLVLVCFAYYSAEFGQNEHHLLIGYVLCGVLCVRLLWGFVGSHHARFSSFLYSPATTLRYALSLRQGHPIHYLGHNPLGAAMVFILVALLVFLAISGLLLTASLEFEGPFLGINRLIDDNLAYLILDLHLVAVYVLFACVAMHVLGVWTASRQHHENLVRSMFTGFKTKPPVSLHSPDEGLK